jgi:hypothetical protein
MLGLMICSDIVPWVLDFNFGSISGFGKVFVAVLMGCLAGFLLMPGRKIYLSRAGVGEKNCYAGVREKNRRKGKMGRENNACAAHVTR